MSTTGIGLEEKVGSSPSPHRRYHFSPTQTMELNSAFSQNPYPSVKFRQELATRLGIDQKVFIILYFQILYTFILQTVTTWFKNQRCRLPKILRKQLLEVNGTQMKRTSSTETATVPKLTNPSIQTLNSYYTNIRSTNEPKTVPSSMTSQSFKVDEERIIQIYVLTLKLVYHVDSK